MTEWILYESERFSITNASKEPEELWNHVSSLKTIFKVLFYNKYFWFEIYSLYTIFRDFTNFSISTKPLHKELFLWLKEKVNSVFLWILCYVLDYKKLQVLFI